MTGPFLIPLILAGAISFAASWIVIKLASRLGIMDDPKKQNHPKVIHTYPIPRGGGLPIYFAVLLTALLMLPFDRHLAGILMGATVLVIMGFLDDKYNLNPYLRLGLGFLAAALPVAMGIGIAFITNPLGGVIDLSQPQINLNLLGHGFSVWVLSDIFAIFWIVFLMNMVNMGAKGVDGQLSGVTVLSALTVAGISLKFSADITEWPVIILAGITAGAYLGFLPWHVYPQKIMPGYGGSTLAGYLLAITAILSTAKVGALVVVLGVPLIDTGYTIIRRILSGKSPVWGDRGHLHHRLLDYGFSKMQVASLYWLVTLILGIMAVSLKGASKLYTIIGIAALLGGIILFLTKKKK